MFTALKFSCPNCHQHIQAEPNYAGLQIVCPACQGSLVVPANPIGPVPPPVPAYIIQPAPARPPQPALRRQAVARATPWYKTAYPYLGFVVLVLGVMAFLAQGNAEMKLALVGVGALYCLVIHIIVVVVAFTDGAGNGFLTLCIPYYGLCYVFKLCDNDTLRILYLGAWIINLALRFLPI
jgi:hypothetical protein